MNYVSFSDLCQFTHVIIDSVMLVLTIMAFKKK